MDLQKSNNTLSYILGMLGMIIMVLVILICIPITIPRLFGFHIYTVVSGSMEPSIPVGSLLYTKRVEPEEIVKGEVITFYHDQDTGAMITHRVLENRVVSGEFITKGDGNEEKDMIPVTYDHYVGRVALSIPYVGMLLSFVASETGKIALCITLAIAVIFRIISSYLLKKENS